MNDEKKITFKLIKSKGEKITWKIYRKTQIVLNHIGNFGRKHYLLLFGMLVFLGAVCYVFRDRAVIGIEEVIGIKEVIDIFKNRKSDLAVLLVDSFYDAILFIPLNNSDTIQDFREQGALLQFLIWISKFGILALVGLKVYDINKALSKSGTSIKIRKYNKKPNHTTVAVYSSEEDFLRISDDVNKYNEINREQLHLFKIDDVMLDTNNVLLIKSEEENIRILSENRSMLQGKKVFMRCNANRLKIRVGEDITMFSYEELTARMFWKESDFYELLCKKKPEVDDESGLPNVTGTCAIVGFDSMMEEILRWALLLNVFNTHDKQNINYVVYTLTEEDEQNFERFKGMYHEIDRIKVGCVKKSKYNYYEQGGVLELESADMIITDIFEVANSIEMISPYIRNIRLLDPYIEKDEEKKEDNSTTQNNNKNDKRIIRYQYMQKIFTIDTLMHQNTLKLAKKLNYYYQNVSTSQENQQNENLTEEMRTQISEVVKNNKNCEITDYDTKKKYGNLIEKFETKVKEAEKNSKSYGLSISSTSSDGNKTYQNVVDLAELVGEIKQLEKNIEGNNKLLRNSVANDSKETVVDNKLLCSDIIDFVDYYNVKNNYETTSEIVLEALWKALDTAQIFSNITTSDYCELLKNKGIVYRDEKLKKVINKGKELANQDEVTRNEKKLTWTDCMIHEVWMRTYFMMNWVPNGEHYGEKERDRENWKHNCLFYDLQKEGDKGLKQLKNDRNVRVEFLENNVL